MPDGVPDRARFSPGHASRLPGGSAGARTVRVRVASWHQARLPPVRPQPPAAAADRSNGWPRLPLPCERVTDTAGPRRPAGRAARRSTAARSGRQTFAAASGGARRAGLAASRRSVAPAELTGSRPADLSRTHPPRPAAWWPARARARVRHAPARVPAVRAPCIRRRAAWSRPVSRRLPPISSAGPPTSAGGPPATRPHPGARREDPAAHVRRDAPAGPPPVNREITISEGITVKELSEKLDVKANLVIKKLVDRNIFATINQTLDSKLATELAREFGASTATVSFEEEAMQEVETAQEEKDQVKRAPVVTIMGHVDHGKTSLLDAIRLANVAEKEAGGITQHIGAYHVEKNGRKIVFIDTPGHEAFTRMRARGAKVTDIVVLVVAADDGVMPQTLEAIDHARAAKVPIIVAINKIDKPDAQPERIKQQLADRGLLAEDWGGDTVMVPVSAKTKTNLDLLLEMILLVADLQDLKANPGRPAMGTVLEAKLDRGRGPVATVLVRNGTLRVGDYFICGAVFGKVRAMLDDRGEPVREAEPSMPVEVLGLESLPEAGDTFQVVTDTAKAKQIVLYREAKAREAVAGQDPAASRSSSCTSR